MIALILAGGALHVSERLIALASEADRMKPVITVEVAIFVNEKAEIMGSYVSSNDGGQAFGNAVKNAMEQWEFEPRLRNGEPPAPRWLVVTWRFRSPYAPPR